MLAIGDDRADRHGTSRSNRREQAGEVLLPGREQALRQEDLAGETVPDDPQDLVAHVRLEPVDGQDDPALARQQLLVPAVVGPRDGEELVVAFEEVGDGPLGHGDAAAS